MLTVLPIVVTTVPAKKNELLKSQLLGLIEFPEGFTPLSQASTITYSGTKKITVAGEAKLRSFPAYNYHNEEDISIY